jgi:glycosyltransferase involved in cell wall biosynthesis
VTERPLVSAILPVYNGAVFIADAIESVLAQTYEPIECIVVDDGSTDGTADVVRGYEPHVRLVQQANQKVSRARNHGAELSSGELLGFLDADDMWRPERVERQWDAIRDRPEVGAVVCGTQVVDGDMNPLRVIQQDPDLTVEDLLSWRAPTASTSSNLLIWRRCFDEMGGFDERLLAASEDWMMTFRLVAAGQLTTVAEPLVTYRVHGANWSLSVNAIERGMLDAYREVFDGPRADPNHRHLRRRAYANLHRMLAGSYFTNGDRARAAWHGMLSVAYHPSAVTYYAQRVRSRLRAR